MLIRIFVILLHVVFALQLKQENGFRTRLFQNPSQTSNHFFHTDLCSNAVQCSTHMSRFRSIIGICNNAVHNTQGSVNQTLRRLVPANYGDNKQGFTRKSSKTTHMMPWWGQFIAHDMVDTPKEKREDGAKYNCNCDSPDLLGCINIKVAKNDPQFIRAGKKCIQVIRSETDKCGHSGVREQINKLTSYLDAGNVYGSSKEDLDELLDPTSPFGELKTGSYEGVGINLPSLRQTSTHFSRKSACNLIFRKPSTMPCLGAGDRRANENTGLTALHTVFLRFHNKIARMLRGINRFWSKDKILQETKLIVAAVQQIITYREFLPVVIGETWMQRFNLKLATKGYWYGYSASYNSDTSSAFTSSAFRFGHSAIDAIMHRVAPHWFGAQGRDINIRESFFNAEPLVNRSEGGVDAIIRGLVVDPSLIVDTNMNKHFQNFLFTHKGILGDDLMAINIQRGRDHGLADYNTYRTLCGFKKATRFSELAEIPINIRQKLSQAYKHVDDIDLYVGGLAESPVEGGSVGPTFACIIGHQFRDLRNGDRYWHENGGILSTFTPKQLSALRKYSLAKLLCDTSADMISLQPHPMMRPNMNANVRISCRSLPELDLEQWNQANNRVSEEYDLPRDNDVEWTTWFPAERDGVELPANVVLQDALLQRTTEVCHLVMSTQSREIGGFKQYRFMCPRGSISFSDFPKFVDHRFETWGEWRSLSDPTTAHEGDDVEIKQTSDCLRIINMQVQTVDQHQPSHETGDVFEEFNPTFGSVVCRGKHQPSQKCRNYQVRFLCRNHDNRKRPNISPTITTTTTTTATTKHANQLVWTPWTSRDTAEGSGDYELLQYVANIRGFCSKPVEMEARTRMSHIPVRSTNDNIYVFDKSFGLICQNRDQIRRQCNDFEVRYKCNSRDVNI